MRSGLAAQQRVESAFAIEGREIIVAADMKIADIDLRHRAPAGLFHHLATARRLQVDADLVDLGDTLGLSSISARWQ